MLYFIMTMCFGDVANLDVEVVSLTSSMNGYTAQATIGLKYTITPKSDVNLWLLDVMGSHIWTDSTAFSVSGGQSIVDSSGSSATTYKDDSNNTWAKLVAGNSYSMTVKVAVSSGAYGEQSFGKNEFDLRSDDLSIYGSYYQTYKYVLPLPVGKLTKTDNISEITRNTIKMNVNGYYLLTESFDSIGLFYKKKGASSWTQATSSTISGLKPNTSYQIRCICQKVITTSDGQSITLTSPYTNSITVTTGLAATPKPVIASVSTSGAKVKTKTVDGHWYKDLYGNWHWQNAYSYKYTSFKVKVKIKKKVPGATGYWVSVAGGKTKFSSKKTFSYTAAVKGKKIGKTVSVKVAGFNQSDGTGMTNWSAAKKVKIK